MNWDAIGAIGQMLGSIAVFITLAYLAIQMWHARTDVERHEFEGQIRGLYATPGAPRKFYELFLKSTQHLDAVHYIDRLLAHPG